MEGLFAKRNTALAARPLRLVLLTLVAALLLPGQASGEPQLQLYIPGSTYVGSEGEDAWQQESWVWQPGEGEDASFELWLLAYNPNDAIDNVRISVAVPRDQIPGGAAHVENSRVEVAWLGGEPIDYPVDPYPYRPFDSPLPFLVLEESDDGYPLTLDFVDVALEHPEDPLSDPVSYVDGHPQLGDPTSEEGTSDLARHGVYPNPFGELFMGTLPTNDASDDADQSNWIWDAIDQHPDENTTYKPGVIYRLQIEVSGFTSVHFDAHDGVYEEPRPAVFAPFSHDAIFTPDPTSISFFGLILVGGIVRRVRARRRKG